MPAHKQILLDQQLKALPFSTELKSICAENNILILNDLLGIEVFNWHKKLKRFNYHHQHEVVSYLIKNDLMEFLIDE
jgi:hypothetical protein